MQQSSVSANTKKHAHFYVDMLHCNVPIEHKHTNTWALLHVWLQVVKQHLSFMFEDGSLEKSFECIGCPWAWEWWLWGDNTWDFHKIIRWKFNSQATKHYGGSNTLWTFRMQVIIGHWLDLERSLENFIKVVIPSPCRSSFPCIASCKLLPSTRAILVMVPPLVRTLTQHSNKNPNCFTLAWFCRVFMKCKQGYEHFCVKTHLGSPNLHCSVYVVNHETCYNDLQHVAVHVGFG